MVNRLQDILMKIVFPEQRAFVKNRRIQDQFVFANEIVDKLQTSKTKVILQKLSL